MLSVIDDQVSLKRKLQHSQVFVIWQRHEVRLTIERGRERGEEVAVLVFEDVLGDLWYPAFLNDTLSSLFRRQLGPVRELEKLRDQVQLDHCDEIVAFAHASS